MIHTLDSFEFKLPRITARRLTLFHRSSSPPRLSHPIPQRVKRGITKHPARLSIRTQLPKHGHSHPTLLIGINNFHPSLPKTPRNCPAPHTVKSWCRRNNITPSSAIATVAGVADVVGCLNCGRKLSGRQSRFCCQTCRRTWWKTHPDLINRKAFYSFTCAHCAKPFSAYGNAKRKYCTHACYIRHRFATRGGRP